MTMRIPMRSFLLKGSLWTGLGASLLALGACLGPTPAGLGTLNPSAAARLQALQAAANVAAVERACDVASARGASNRAQKKALDMTLSWASDNPKAAERPNILHRAAPIVAALASGPAACEAVDSATRLLEVSPDFDRDGGVFVRLAKDCMNTRGALRVAHMFSQADRCPESIETIRAIWPRSHQADWMMLLSEIDSCSSPVSITRNMAFVPEDVRTAYIAERERQRQAAEQRAAEDRRNAEQRAAEDRERRFQAAQQAAAMQEDADRRARAEVLCQNDCIRSASSCRAACSSERCLSRCDSEGLTCRSSCYR